MIAFAHYRLMALIRFVLFWLLRPTLRHERYGNPQNVGYLGWWEALGKVLVFERMDGTRQYLW